MKHLKLGWAYAATCSKNPSSPFKPINHDYIRCTFYNIIHVPSLAALNNAYLALSS